MATFKQLPSGNWRVQVRRKGRYIGETFRRRKDADEWALEAERRIDRGETPSSRGRIDPTMTTDRFAARLQSKTACSLISDCPPD